MSEHDNLQDADGDNLKATPQTINQPEEVISSSEPQTEALKTELPSEELTANPEEVTEKVTADQEKVAKEVTDDKEKVTEEVTEDQADVVADQEVSSKEKDSAVNYEDLSLEALIAEFESLLKTENVHSVRNSINEVKNNFNAKFSFLISEKKEAFLAEGGNTIDFEFISPLKKQFNELSKTFREKNQSFQKNRTQELNQNLEIRLQIIEEIKGLINVEGDVNSSYNTFKNLQERWRNTGQIPSSENNNTWNNYRHHVEIFYGFLHLNMKPW